MACLQARGPMAEAANKKAPSSRQRTGLSSQGPWPRTRKTGEWPVLTLIPIREDRKGPFLARLLASGSFRVPAFPGLLPSGSTQELRPGHSSASATDFHRTSERQERIMQRTGDAYETTSTLSALSGFVKAMRGVKRFAGQENRARVAAKNRAPTRVSKTAPAISMARSTVSGGMNWLPTRARPSFPKWPDHARRAVRGGRA